ncbi:hypothetical protein NKH75_28460 [Mesorhizobium sp. M0984]|uniref:hypothetical protein n=1 Tax=unclassified Mesorhizobium TaxID=325217 RepID=UPI0033372F0C
MKIAAIYARVSSDQQKEENTIASQTAALVEFPLYRTSTRSLARKSTITAAWVRMAGAHLSGSVCDSRPIRQDLLDHIVWQEVIWLIEELQADLDEWVRSYNEERPRQGRWCFGNTPMQTFLDTAPLAKEKMIAA